MILKYKQSLISKKQNKHRLLQDNEKFINESYDII